MQLCGTDFGITYSLSPIHCLTVTQCLHQCKMLNECVELCNVIHYLLLHHVQSSLSHPSAWEQNLHCILRAVHVNCVLGVPACHYLMPAILSMLGTRNPLGHFFSCQKHGKKHQHCQQRLHKLLKPLRILHFRAACPGNTLSVWFLVLHSNIFCGLLRDTPAPHTR